MRKTLDAKYDHLKVEQNHYNDWVEQGYFTAGDKSKDPFCIVTVSYTHLTLPTIA